MGWQCWRDEHWRCACALGPFAVMRAHFLTHFGVSGGCVFGMIYRIFLSVLDPRAAKRLECVVWVHVHATDAKYPEQNAFF